MSTFAPHKAIAEGTVQVSSLHRPLLTLLRRWRGVAKAIETGNLASAQVELVKAVDALDRLVKVVIEAEVEG